MLHLLRRGVPKNQQCDSRSVHLDRTPVSSSNIVSIGYEPDSGTLEIEFNNGSVYQYSNVPQAEYDGLTSAASHGTYFNANIKNRYSFVKM